MSKTYYIAYGSNLNIESMKVRCPDAKPVGKAVLPDYKLVYRGKWRDSFLTIEPAEGRPLPIGVWQISPRDEMMLDRYEGYPYFYYKKNMLLPVVDCGDHVLRDVTALVYIINKEYEAAIPSADYLEECIQGYRDFGFDPQLLHIALEETTRMVEDA